MSDPAESATSIVSALLTFISSLLWPGVTLWFIVRFRRPIEALINRLQSAKVAGTELVFQPPAPDALPATPEAKVELADIDANGFFTGEGVRRIVEQAHVLPSGEKCTGELLLLSTDKQHTWLVASKSKVAIVLDDEKTRAKNRLVQRVMDKDSAVPLSFGMAQEAGLVGFGSYKGRWYYTYSLFPTTDALSKSFEALIR